MGLGDRDEGTLIPIKPLSEIQDRSYGKDDGWEQIA